MPVPLLRPPYGIVAAMASEYRTARRGSRGYPDQVLIRHSGIGPDRARRAALDLIREGAKSLISFGFAGGLDPGIERGDLLIPREVMNAAGDRLPTSPLTSSALIGCFAPLITTSDPVHHPRDKSALCAATGAAAVDTESFAIGELASNYECGFLVLRAVVDTAATELPKALTDVVDEFGRPQLSRLIPWLARNPTQLPIVINLARAEAAARQTLVDTSREFLATSGPD